MAPAMAAREDWEVLVLDVQTAFHRGTGGICEDFSRLRITRRYNWTSQRDGTHEELARTSSKISQLVQRHRRFTEEHEIHSYYV